MSASTRTVQRTLGTSQLGGMIVLLAVLAAIVAAIAFSTIGAKPADVTPAAGFVTPATLDYVPRHEIGATKGQTDMSGGLMFQPAPAPGFVTPATTDYVPRHEIGANGNTDMSGGLMFQPPAGDPVKGGRNDERLRGR
ncbi:MAG TPA: hypothetical protein VFO73_05510 [Candidatus Limnocylindrales bacterium]|nr:hypothetical protein [Candidatus Limnocylindrales bacterium]